MHNRIVNKIRFNDLGKPMKQTSFTVKKPGGKPSKIQSTIVKKSFKIQYKRDTMCCETHVYSPSRLTFNSRDSVNNGESNGKGWNPKP